MVQSMFDTEQALNQIGLSMYRFDFACHLLAFVGEVGSEHCVLNKAMFAAIRICQWKAGIIGGYIPDLTYMAGIQNAREELRGGNAWWLPSLLNRYNIKPTDIKSFLGTTAA